ncbi:MAG: anthranilate synthase component I family protein [Planctomycetota bacterium]|nr:anthranilate synthase component I family protein [Planctomycetota bacterium]
MKPLRRSTPADAATHQLAWAVYPADRLTPVRAFELLRAAGRQGTLLESVEGPERLASHSFVAVDPDGKLRGGAERASLRIGGGAEEILPLGPSDALREASRRTGRAGAGAAHPDLPPFRGGWIGSLSYEWASTLEERVPRPSVRDFDQPEALFDHYPNVVAFDHGAQTLTILCAAPEGEADHHDAAAHVERLARELAGVPPAERGFRLLEDAPRPSMSREDFEAGVRSLQEAIRAGEIFQCVLSQRFRQRFEGDAFTLYRVLRLVNPAPHMFFFEAGDVTLVGSSPERLVSVQDGRIEVVPIAGTRPRGATSEEDARLGAELRRDEKECAEHDMLVDLARNDAGRVASFGSVEVEEHRRLVRFPRVQHLVSRVRARLSAGKDALDALEAAFPAGTVSGAPKVRAMTLCAGIEQRDRGAYGGAFGYLDRAGNLDMAIAIRTIVCSRGELFVQAGAGVVLDSDPSAEFEETLHKSQALFEAVELAASEAFQPEGAAAPTTVHEATEAAR